MSYSCILCGRLFRRARLTSSHMTRSQKNGAEKLHIWKNRLCTDFTSNWWWNNGCFAVLVKISHGDLTNWIDCTGIGVGSGMVKFLSLIPFLKSIVHLNTKQGAYTTKYSTMSFRSSHFRPQHSCVSHTQSMQFWLKIRLSTSIDYVRKEMWPCPQMQMIGWTLLLPILLPFAISAQLWGVCG